MMYLVLMTAFLVPFISSLLVFRLTLKIKNGMSYLASTMIAMIITEIAYVIQALFHFGPTA